MNEKWLFIIGFFAVVIGIGVVATLVNNYFEKKRTAAFEQLAGELNFEFFPNGAVGLQSEVSEFHLFSIGRNRVVKNHMQGKAGGIELNIFDFRYVVGSGKHQDAKSSEAKQEYHVPAGPHRKQRRTWNYGFALL